MNNIIEKITLYDILGYAFSGIFFMVMNLVAFYKVLPCEIVKLIKDCDGIMIIPLLVLSHIIGSILSEISKIILSLSPKYLRNMNSITDDMIKAIENSGSYMNDELKNAFEKSGVSSFTKDEGRHVLTKESLVYLYSDIQTDTNYSRVHTYASASVMCRNTATASLLVSIFIIIFIVLSLKQRTQIMTYQVIMAVILMVSALLLYKRGKVFTYKKYFYAVNWFIQKYYKK